MCLKSATNRRVLLKGAFLIKEGYPLCREIRISGNTVCLYAKAIKTKKYVARAQNFSHVAISSVCLVL